MNSEHSVENRPDKLVVFVVLAYGLTWACWIPALVIADREGCTLPTIANLGQGLGSGFSSPRQVLLTLLFSLAVYGPLAAALAATWLESGKAGRGKLFARVARWRIPAKWYAAAVGVVLMLSLVPRAAGELLGMVSGWAGWPLPLLLGVLLWQVLTSGLGEEPGWRGYALPRLQARLGGEKAIWALGLIWAGWHYPFTIYETLSHLVDVPPAGMAITLVMALAGQTISLVGMTYLYAWLYNNTGSVFLVILFHGLSNFLPAVLLAGAAPGLTVMTAVMPWVVVFILEKVYGKERFPGSGAVL